MLQKEANKVLQPSISLRVLFLSILFLDEGFIKLCSSLKYLGRLMLIDRKNIIWQSSEINGPIFLHMLICL